MFGQLSELIQVLTPYFALMERVNRLICKYISEEWISKSKSKNAFALDHNIDEKTVRRIISDKKYAMQIETLNKICEAQNIKLSEFFKKVEDKYL
ncbi:helix-turn-helix transcriptional regulator [Flavivirga aquimarina]|uniref:Helix-turn-helix transcriptional regulator n=1 Tax=Flavivirga aquimarina TaxID=2027862 RepID=A0ABT8WCM5_9FLAO|nr:helix-turn-helix transcriptional regulator [Flavivirga aquimarina]MDO5970900.1 helix-turn-helix transcriptional regulator [Flavivirga aquimarina]